MRREDDRPALWALYLLFASALLSVAVSQIALGLALLAGAVVLVRRRERPPRLGVELPLFCLVAWILATIPFGDQPIEALIRAKRLTLFLPLWVCAAFLRTERRRGLALALLIAAATLNAVYSLVDEVLLPGYAPRHRLHMVQDSTMTASWLMMAAALAAGAVVARARRPLYRWSAAAALVPVLAAVILCQSRSAWLGFVTGAALLLFYWKRRLVLAGAAVLLVLVCVPGPIHDRAATIVDPDFRTNQQRFALWRTGRDLFLSSPVFGVGDRDLSEVTPGFVVVSGGRRTVHPGHLHQNLIMFGVLWGTPGLVLGLWMLVAVFWRLLGGVLAAGGKGDRGPPAAAAWRLAGLAVWTALLVAGGFDWTFGDAELSLLTWAVVGMALGARDVYA
jgi:O-antigen ligase